VFRAALTAAVENDETASKSGKSYYTMSKEIWIYKRMGGAPIKLSAPL
jgi:hypothetical protein